MNNDSYDLGCSSSTNNSKNPVSGWSAVFAEMKTKKLKKVEVSNPEEKKKEPLILIPFPLEPESSSSLSDQEFKYLSFLNILKSKLLKWPESDPIDVTQHDQNYDPTDECVSSTANESKNSRDMFNPRYRNPYILELLEEIKNKKREELKKTTTKVKEFKELFIQKGAKEAKEEIAWGSNQQFNLNNFLRLANREDKENNPLRDIASAQSMTSPTNDFADGFILGFLLASINSPFFSLGSMIPSSPWSSSMRSNNADASLSIRSLIQAAGQGNTTTSSGSRSSTVSSSTSSSTSYSFSSTE